MTNLFDVSRSQPRTRSSVVALHCSLGSGRQWTRLAAELGSHYQFIAPDLSGYGNHVCAVDLPMTLAQEVEFLSDRIGEAAGPIHLVGHSYGGAVAFKIATDSHFAKRVRSLTLIEPVLPTLLGDDEADRRLHDGFAIVAREVSQELWDGSTLEAIDKFTEFWNGSGPQEPLPASARLRMIERADKLAFDFTAAFAEQGVAAAARRLRVPTLLLSGGCRPISPSASSSGSPTSSTARTRGICRAPATCCRSRMRRSSIRRSSRHISRADELAESARWRSAGKSTCPLVPRRPSGIQHQLEMEGP